MMGRWPLARRTGTLCAERMNRNGHRRRGSWLYAPLGWAFFAALVIVGLLVISLAALDALSYVYHRIGISLGWMAIILAAALLGSVINIPVARLRAEIRHTSATATVFGVTYRIPVAVRTRSTTIAVNVGGAIVPMAVAIFLICHDRLRLAALFATLIDTAVVFAAARPVAGVGIVTPGQPGRHHRDQSSARAKAGRVRGPGSRCRAGRCGPRRCRPPPAAGRRTRSPSGRRRTGPG